MTSQFSLTVFTPTYNRAHTLPRLYKSLLEQAGREKFEWLIIDDCSQDNTSELVNEWITANRLNIHYIKLDKNGGKPRAINIAVEKACSPYLFIVDSDDFLVSGIIPRLISELDKIAHDDTISGVGVMRQYPDGKCFAKPMFRNYIDATNLQRPYYGLDADCNEAYKISVLRQFPFKVWEGEIFTPEATELNAMAAAGYKIRWLATPGVISEYQEDGLTKGSWNLQKKNPMGYAMLFNSNLLYAADLRQRIYATIQFTAQCLLGKHPEYLRKSNAKFLTLITLPAGILVYARRLWQYRRMR